MAHDHFKPIPARSFVHRRLIGAGATFAVVNGGMTAVSLEGDNRADPGRCALVDLSPLPRTGFKGTGTIDWLTRSGLDVPSEPNLSLRGGNGETVLRLALDEVSILSDLRGKSRFCNELDERWRDERSRAGTNCGYRVPCRDGHAWFVVTGTAAPKMFAKICGVDLRLHKFRNGQIAQTQAARLSTIIARDDRESLPLFHVLVESSAAEYMWDCLLDSMREFGGRPVGLETLRQLRS